MDYYGKNTAFKRIWHTSETFRGQYTLVLIAVMAAIWNYFNYGSDALTMRWVTVSSCLIIGAIIFAITLKKHRHIIMMARYAEQTLPMHRDNCANCKARINDK